MNGSITVVGVAQPQGNKSAFVINGRAVLVEGRRGKSRAAFKDWRAAVSREAGAWVKANGMPEPIAGGVVLEIEFHLPRPKSLPKRVVHHTKKPDVDKLSRLIGDSLTGIVFHDDSNVVELRAKKVYAKTVPCARISWSEVS